MCWFNGFCIAFGLLYQELQELILPAPELPNDKYTEIYAIREFLAWLRALYFLLDYFVKIGYFYLTSLVKIGYNIIHVRKHYILCFAHMACRGVLGLHMAVCGAQNTTHANIESRIARARPFRYPYRAKNHGAVILRRGK